jgi:hypothetical protein
MLKRLRNRFLNCELPTRWEGLSAEQFVQVAALVWKGGPAFEVRARILWVLLGLGWKTPLRMAGFFYATTAEERWDLARRVAEGFLKQGPMVASPLGELKAGSHRLRLKWSDQLNHLDAETWGTADTCFLRYQQKQDLDQLRYLVADTWQSKDAIAAANACTEQQLLAVALQWAMQRKVLERECPTVFGKGNKNHTAARTGWGDVLLQWSGDVFGTFNETRKTPARTFLHRLEQAMNQPVVKK